MAQPNLPDMPQKVQSGIALMIFRSLNFVFCCCITREWYSYHFPELVKIVSDNYMYARTAQYVKSRKDLTEDMIEGLEEIVMDSAKAKAIYDASKSSMGR